MIFQSGAKLRRFKFTVYPTPPRIDPTNGQRVLTSMPLRAIFKYGNEHTFDSIEAQAEYGWSDEEREIVERKLLDPRNGYLNKHDGRGIFLFEEETQAPQVSPDASLCQAVRASDGEPCPNAAVDGGLYCDEHIMAAVDDSTEPIEEEPDIPQESTV